MAELLVEQYAEQITSYWQQSTAAILEAAASCKEASDALSSLEKKRLLARLPFSSSTFSKLVAIGGDSRIANPKIRQLLPPSFSSMYEVTLLNDDQLKRAVKERLLSPHTKRAAISKWREGENKSTRAQALYGSIYLTQDLADEEFTELRQQLECIAVRYSLRLSLREASFEKRRAAWQKKIEKHINSECRRVLQKFKRNRPAHKLKTYGAEEITITANSTEEEILFVFESIGYGESVYHDIVRDVVTRNPTPTFSHWGNDSNEIPTDFNVPYGSKRRSIIDVTKWK